MLRLERRKIMGEDLRENHAQEFVPNGEEKGTVVWEFRL